MQVLILLAALGFSGGFFVVPINALIQHRPDEAKKGGVIAFANWLSFVGVMLASAIYSGFTHYLHIGLRTFFAATALASLAAAIYTVWLLPDSLLRLLLWFATHTIYRMDISGARACSGARRGAAGAESRFDCRCSAGDCGDRPPSAISDVQGYLRTSADQAVRQDYWE